MQLKIVHVVEPFAAGVAVFVKTLVEAMPNEIHIVVHGERKIVMPAKKVKSIFPQENTYFIKWKSAQRSINPFKDILALYELFLTLKKLKKKGLADVVHLHSSKSGLLGRIACKLAGIKNVIYTPNGAPFLSDGSFISKGLFKLLEIIGDRIGGKVVCCSLSELKEYLDLGIKATYVNNGISMANIDQHTSPSKKKGKFKVITTGRIETQKNPILFNSIASFFEDFEQIEFIWAGDGNERNALSARNIKVTGWIEPGEVKELVEQADVFLSTSVFEGLSFSVLEALSLRKPMLVSECVGNTDVIRNGMNGDVFKNETEAIAKIMNYFNNREMLEVMGQNSLSLCKADFSIEENYKSYKDIYLGIGSMFDTTLLAATV